MRAGWLIVAAGVLGACSYPQKELTDGAGAPFGCLNAPTPTKADNPSVMSGMVVDAMPGTPLANAAVAGQFVGGTTSIFTAHTNAMGRFSQSQNTGGVPLDLFFAISANGYITTYYYPPYMLTHDIDYSVLGPTQLFTMDARNNLQAASQLTFDPTKGQMIVTVNDCNGRPVPGATISTSPAGTIRYFAGVVPSTTATATDQLAVVLVANLPPGNVALSATVNGMNLKSHNVQIVADAIVQTAIQP